MELGKKQDEDFNNIKKQLTEEPCLAHYAKDRDNIVTTDANKTGLGITLWQKQSDGKIKPIAFGSRYLNESEQKYSIGELELLAVVWGLEKFRFYLYGKKVFLYTDHQALEPLIKRNRCNRQYSARLTRWLDRLAHFDIAIQHIAGSNLKFTDISRPGTMRRKFDMNAQRQIWVPSRPNKRSREEIAEIDGELLTRANRLGGGYQPIEDRTAEDEDPNNNNNHQQPEIIEEENEPESEGESQIIRGDIFPIVDLKAYNTEGREAQFIQINQVVEKMTGDKKATEDAIKKAEFNFMLDLKTLIAKSNTDAELHRVRDAMRRAEKNTAPESYRTVFEKLSNKWGLTFNEYRIIIPTELRKKLLDTLHFGHAGSTKVLAESKIFWWPNMCKKKRGQNQKLRSLHGLGQESKLSITEK